MDREKLFAVAVALSSFALSLANAGTVNTNPSKDNALYEYDRVDGDRSNALEHARRRFFSDSERKRIGLAQLVSTRGAQRKCLPMYRDGWIPRQQFCRPPAHPVAKRFRSVPVALGSTHYKV